MVPLTITLGESTCSEREGGEAESVQSTEIYEHIESVISPIAEVRQEFWLRREEK